MTTSVKITFVRFKFTSLLIKQDIFFECLPNSIQGFQLTKKNSITSHQRLTSDKYFNAVKSQISNSQILQPPNFLYQETEAEKNRSNY